MNMNVKLATTLLVAGLLLTSAASGAAEEAATAREIAPQSQALLPQLLGGEALATPAEGCAAPDPWALVSGQEAVPAAVQTCGSCSVPNCRGSIRGGRCHLGSGLGYGNCNTFSSQLRCSTGGFNCQCSDGEIP